MAQTRKAESYSWKVEDLRKEIIQDIKLSLIERLCVKEDLYVESFSAKVTDIDEDYCIVERNNIRSLYYTEMHIEDLITILEYIQNNHGN